MVYVMSVVVGLDLVVPAVISAEIKILNELEINDDKLYSDISISIERVMYHAEAIKSRPYLDVKTNFGKKEIEEYFESQPHLFKKRTIKSYHYKIVPPTRTEGIIENPKKNLLNWLTELLIQLNYSEKVLKAAGLGEKLPLKATI
jgi:hypothetical protein